MQAWDITHKLFYSTNKIIKIKNCKKSNISGHFVKRDKSKFFFAAPQPKHF